MITLDEVLSMTDLTPEEIGAIAEHEHLPEAAAAALGDWLMHCDTRGEIAVRDMIKDDIRAAIRKGDRQHAAELVHALSHFLSEHKCGR